MNTILDSSTLELIARLFFAFVAGFIIGLEREKSGNSAGLKTHILVSVGACLIMIISIKAFDGGDPARLAAQVVSGIGFIGAGAIMRDNSGSVRGITTAATLWIVAGLGLGFGSGMFFYTLAALLIVTITLIFVKKIEKKYIHKNCIITFICKTAEPITETIINTFAENNILIKDFVINPLTKDGISDYSKVIIKVSATPDIKPKLSKTISTIASKLNVQNLNLKNIIL